MTDHDEERRRNHRRSDDHRHLQWCARTIGGIVAITAVVSVGASASIATLIASHSVNMLNARIDAIRLDVNDLTVRVMRSPLTPLEP